jgi:mRNA-degrading endonuclease RelE of RelBE toxin-antitoxin system
LNAEWSPANGAKWVEKDFESEMKKMEKEAAERLDAKIKELEANIATAGKSK